MQPRRRTVAVAVPARPMVGPIIAEVLRLVVQLIVVAALAVAQCASWSPSDLPRRSFGSERRGMTAARTASPIASAVVRGRTGGLHPMWAEPMPIGWQAPVVTAWTPVAAHAVRRRAVVERQRRPGRAPPRT